MTHNRFATAHVGLAFIAIGCGSGQWTVTTWGEDYIEQGIPADVFADGCAVVFDTFNVEITDVALLDGDDTEAATIPGRRFALTEAGPQDVGSADAPATHYDTARFAIGPSGGPSIAAAGTLTCGDTSVTFDWQFETNTTYYCEPADLTLPAGGKSVTEFTIHGDHLFYDGLENPDANVRGEAIVNADQDGDGAVTQSELAAVSVAELGYAVGQYSEVTHLADFIAFLTQTVGHVDGEGHCAVDL